MYSKKEREKMRLFFVFVGFYVYPELSEMVEQSTHYGIPKDLTKTGFDSDGQLCELKQGQHSKHFHIFQ